MRPRVLLSVPLYGWAFHHQAQQLVRHLSERFDLTVKILREVSPLEEYDLTVVFLWTEAERLRMRLVRPARAVTCLFDHSSTSREHGLTLFQRAVRNCVGVIAGNPPLVARARELGASRVWLCQDGVDLEMFRPLPPPAQFAVGWCGNSAIGDGTYKGHEIIREACARAGAPLVVQGFEDKIPQSEMCAKFYSRASVYACASVAEGTPNPVLEALACGRPVVSTRVGIVDQVLRHGENGLFAERSVEAFASAVRELRTWNDRTAACRAAVLPHGWADAARHWADAFESVLEK